MTSTKPYLIRAFYDWISDNQFTPYLVVDATQDDVDVPQNFIEDGKIVLNISFNAVRELNLDNDYIFFNASFSGSALQITIPVSAVLAIYAKENGRGMVFNEEFDDGDDTDEDGGIPPSSGPSGAGPTGGKNSSRKGKPKLTVVK